MQMHVYSIVRLNLKRATRRGIYPARRLAPVIVSNESKGAVLMKLTAM